MKFGGKGMIQLMVLLYNWVWKNEYTPSRWREGVVVNLFKKGDKTDPGNYRGITLLNTVGKVFCKLLNDRIVGVLEKEHSISEGQAGFRKKRGCVDHVFPVGRIIQGFRKKRGCVDHVFTVGRIIQGRKRAGKPTYCFFLDVKKAYDTVVMVCNKSKEEPVEHRWKWGMEEIAVVDQYTYLGVEIAKDCSWNAHMSKVAEKGKSRAGKLHPILANRHLDTRIKLTVLKSVIVPPLEYAGEVWEANKERAYGRGSTSTKMKRWKRRVQGIKKISVACTEREEQNLRNESKDKAGLEVYGMLKEGIGFRDYLHGPMDAGTKLEVKFRTGDTGLRERRRRHTTVDNADDEFNLM
ncbi:unnamed protein product [Ectocarpus sp. CCAP 1310/34]|nr:unnamed protein product [Ectocarpus sp. CCAP 1310/34]